ncbi:Hypothetical protein ACI5QM_00282 [Bacillus subtilis]
MTYIVQTNGLTKTYQGKEVVSNVSMHIKKGEIYGFLGFRDHFSTGGQNGGFRFWRRWNQFSSHLFWNA